jgi:hypothetical protein
MRMARLEDAVREADGGTALSLEVQPGARTEGFPAGFNPWRGRIQARVRAPPEDGEANRALVGLVANYFMVPEASVHLAQGQGQRQKTVIVHGLPWRDAVQRLGESLQAQR